MVSGKTHRCGRVLCTASALAAFVRHDPVAVPGGIPDIVRASARRCQQPDPKEYLKTIELKAIEHRQGDAIAGRDKYRAVLQELFDEPGLNLVVGGKSIGKTKIMQTVVSGMKAPDRVLYVNMREPGTKDVMLRLEQKLLDKGPAFLQMLGKAADIAKLDGVLSPLKGPWRAIFAAARFGIAAAPEVKLEKFFQRIRGKGKVPVVIIDEANIALPNGESQEARDFMSFAVKVSKEDTKVAVILISSEYGYPYRLEAVGLNGMDVVQVMVAPEIEQEPMIEVLRNEWGMTQELAEAFEEYFGGNLFLCQLAVSKLKKLLDLGKEEFFSPFGVLSNVGLRKLVENKNTRGHMENIADKGWSAVVESNEAGAKDIVKQNYGAVIDRKVLTFEIPKEAERAIEVAFDSGIEQVLIPPSKHLRKCIQQKVERSRLARRSHCNFWEAVLRWR